MICAIACANKSRYMPCLSASDAEFCESASRTYSTSRNVLRVRGIPALLVLYCLFHPRKGDIWKLLDYSVRLPAQRRARLPRRAARLRGQHVGLSLGLAAQEHLLEPLHHRADRGADLWPPLRPPQPHHQYRLPRFPGS